MSENQLGRHMRTRNWNLSTGTTSSTTRWNVGIEDSVSYMGVRNSYA